MKKIMIICLLGSFAGSFSADVPENFSIKNNTSAGLVIIVESVDDSFKTYGSVRGTSGYYSPNGGLFKLSLTPDQIKKGLFISLKKEDEIKSVDDYFKKRVKDGDEPYFYLNPNNRTHIKIKVKEFRPTTKDIQQLEKYVAELEKENTEKNASKIGWRKKNLNFYKQLKATPGKYIPWLETVESDKKTKGLADSDIYFFAK